MQRLHEDDLVGHVLEQENWDHIRLPAIAEEDRGLVVGICPRVQLEAQSPQVFEIKQLDRALPSR